MCAELERALRMGTKNQRGAGLDGASEFGQPQWARARVDPKVDPGPSKSLAYSLALWPSDSLAHTPSL